MRKWIGIGFILMIIGGMIAGSTTSATADIPDELSYQGYLTDSGGTPIDTTVSVIFRIYDSEFGVIPIWQETHASLEVSDGLFTTILGSGSSGWVAK